LLAIEPGNKSRATSHEFWEFVGASDEQQCDEEFVKGFFWGVNDVLQAYERSR
jgi:hypothetical protein